MVLPRPSTVDAQFDDIPDLMRDREGVIVSAGGRDKGPSIKRGPGGGKRPIHDTQVDEIQYEKEKHKHYVNKVVDPLRDLHRRGSIDDAQFEAGVIFQDDFDRAHWHSSGGMRFDMMPPSGKISNDDGRTDSVIDARDKVIGAITAVGGESSIGGRVLWWVVGMRRSINDLAADDNRNRMVLRGALEGALSVLKTRYQRIGR